ncbi:MAG: trehalose-phosphatase [Candidatus Marinimicrobia bacterium]|nr:trehalose-phosphatase [Candidatus Neomarinimicrobiota bacterium]
MTKARKLPSALEKDSIFTKLGTGMPLLFLDYDGTLTPIVDDPSQALMPDKVRRLLERLAEHWKVVIMTGRALKDARKLVDLDNIFYAGSHGFNMQGPGGDFHEEPGKRFLSSLDKAETEVRDAIEGLEGVRPERKPYALALHFRGAEKSVIPELEKRLDAVLEHFPDLTKTHGKKIFELRPDTDWDKGEAMMYLVKKFAGDVNKAVPLYIGDDVTDEDAFRAMGDKGSVFW